MRQRGETEIQNLCRDTVALEVRCDILIEENRNKATAVYIPHQASVSNTTDLQLDLISIPLSRAFLPSCH